MPPSTDAIPSGGGGAGVLVGRLALRLMRWRIVGELPRIPRYVLIVAPHTANADFFVGLAAKFALGLKAKWLGKHSIFVGPIGWVLRALGGVPVDRARADGTVEAVLDQLRASSTFVLALSPEGTRKRTEGWKTGFYRIATAGGVPVVPVAFDWSTRTIALMPPFRPTGDVSGDIRALRALYVKRMARRPEFFSDVHDPLPAVPALPSGESSPHGNARP